MALMYPAAIDFNALEQGRPNFFLGGPFSYLGH